MRFTGHHTIGKTRLVEVVELPAEMHPWFVAHAGASGVQVAAEPAGAALSRLHRRGARARRAHRRPRRRRRGGILDPGLITAVVLTRDEERNLPRALTSLPRGIATIRARRGLARPHACSSRAAPERASLQREWTDFVDARRFALSQVETPWTLMIDADEALDDVLRDAILDAPDERDAYRVTAHDVFLRQADAHLARRAAAAPVPNRSRHARAASGGGRYGARARGMDAATERVGDLHGTLLHYSYPDVATYRAKYDRYTTRRGGEYARLAVWRWLAA